MTAATLPEFRRRGVFRGLLRAVQEKASVRAAARLLLVSYRASESGQATVQALELSYDSSEYRMEANVPTLAPLPGGQMQLVQVEPSTIASLTHITAQTFGQEAASSEALTRRLQQEGSRYFLGQLDGTSIGQIGVVARERVIYIRGFGILPEYRRQGYGRQLLSAAVNQMLAEGYMHLTLEVSTDNPQALSLYRSCGFHESTVYDYYDVPL